MLLVSNVQRFCTHDGPGLRTTLFLKGCPFTCPWCCNPENRCFAPQYSFMPEECLRYKNQGCEGCAGLLAAHHLKDPAELAGRLADGHSPCALAIGRWGEMKSDDDLFDMLLADARYHRDSGGGITFSGGEPLSHPIGPLAAKLHATGAHLAMETTLLIDRPDLAELLALFSLLLVDVKILDQERSRSLLAQPIERLRSNLSLAISAGCQIVLRVPLIPDYTATDENLQAVCRLIREFDLKHIHLLPFHRMGDEKGRRINAPLFVCPNLDASLPIRYGQEIKQLTLAQVEVLSF